MDRAAHRIAGQLAQVERLLHDPFADEGRVAVDQDRHAPLVVEVGAAVLLGPREPQGHRVDELQVAGIEAQREVDLAARRSDVVVVVAQVILDVAAAAIQLGIDVLEFAEDVLRRLADDVGQDVEPAAVGHGHDDRLDALRRGLFDGQVQQRDEALGPFQRKALGADELAADELLEDHGVGQPREDADLFVAGKLQAVLRFFHPPLQPLAHFQVVDVHELGADRPAIGVAEPVHDVAERLRVRAGQRVGRELAIEIGFRKPPELRFQFRRHGPRNAQRIDLGDQVSADAVVADQQVDAFLQAALGVRFPVRVGR